MYMKKAILALAFVALTAANSFAVGKPEFGVKVGGVDSTLTGDITNMKSKVGLAAGAFVEIPVVSQLSVQPEVMYVMKGAKVDSSLVDAKYKIDVLEIPVLLKWKFSTESAKVVPSVFVGPSIGFKLSAKEVVEDKSADIQNIKSTDFGLVFGAGVEFSKFTVDARYDLGLTNLNNADNKDDYSVKNAAFLLCVGYKFN
jgi:cellobiose-specific phosphotransferase system component IIB